MKRFFQIIAFTLPFFMLSCSSSDEESSSSGLGKHKGHEYVDLGLPSGTKWATCNVGASSPYADGYYVAWGETETKDACSLDNYKFGSNENNYSKYNNSDKKTTLDLEDDIAHVKWGGSWRMPTEEELNELIEECYWSWDSEKCGYLVRGHTGNTIFLYASGFKEVPGRTYELGEYLYYWTNTVTTSYGKIYYKYASILNIRKNASSVDVTNNCSSKQRFYGLQVRPVLPK